MEANLKNLGSHTQVFTVDWNENTSTVQCMSFLIKISRLFLRCHSVIFSWDEIWHQWCGNLAQIFTVIPKFKTASTKQWQKEVGYFSSTQPANGHWKFTNRWPPVSFLEAVLHFLPKFELFYFKNLGKY